MLLILFSLICLDRFLHEIELILNTEGACLHGVYFKRNLKLKSM